MVKSLLVAAAAAVALAGCSAADDTAYMQASSAVTQTGGGVVAFDTFGDATGIAYEAGAFTVPADGPYVVVAAPQVGGFLGDAEAGSANFWITVNGEDVPDSNVTWVTDVATNGDVIISQGVVELVEGDQVGVEWSTTGPAIEAIETPGEPLTPSIIFTMFGV